MWLGGLLNPEAYITATRQCIAQANNWSLEELVLDVTITDSNNLEKTPLDDCSFGVTGTYGFFGRLCESCENSSEPMACVGLQG